MDAISLCLIALLAVGGGAKYKIDKMGDENNKLRWQTTKLNKVVSSKNEKLKQMSNKIDTIDETYGTFTDDVNAINAEFMAHLKYNNEQREIYVKNKTKNIDSAGNINHHIDNIFSRITATADKIARRNRKN